MLGIHIHGKAHMIQATAGRGVRARPMTNLELAVSLGAKSEDLREALQLHVKTFGTLVPHIFMGDVLTHVRSHALAKDRKAELGRILDCLETGMDVGGRETCNVISLSFLREAENEVFFPAITAMLGPRARAQLRGKI